MNRTLCITAAALVTAGLGMSAALAQVKDRQDQDQGQGQGSSTIESVAPPPTDMTMKMTADLVGSVLANLGIDYSEQTNDDGSPYLEIALTSDMPGEQAIVFFHDCAQDGTCEDIRMWSWYDITPSLDEINQWNADGRWTKAYIDQDQDAVLEMDINATGGIGTEALAILINTYLGYMPEFAQFINYR